MPLTYVVEHLNNELKRIHTNSRIQKSTEIKYDSNKVYAISNGFRIDPLQVPVFDVKQARTVASDTALSVLNSENKTINPNLLYLNIWDANDIIFLDRFLRTLHALNHINLGRENKGQLILDVHIRHISSVPSQHGQVFEKLLSELGLTPSNITLRIDLNDIKDNQHARDAVQSFIDRGYQILATVNSLDEILLHDLSHLGVTWISANNLIDNHIPQLKIWNLKANLLDLKTVLTEVNSNNTLNSALNIGFDIVSGRLLSPEIPVSAVEMSTIGRILRANTASNTEIRLGV